MVASELSGAALRHGGQILDATPFKTPRLYFYDNGPRHTIGFAPDTYINVADVWQDAADWLGELMALVRNEPYDRVKPDGAVLAKEALARYRGAACGSPYAEALWEGVPRPQEFL